MSNPAATRPSGAPVLSRSAAWAAIISGILGCVAFALLITALVLRGMRSGSSDVFFRSHDIGVLLHALLMIPLTISLSLRWKASRLSQRASLLLGVVGQAGVALFLLLVFVGNPSDMLYMLPQGLVGLWLILINLELRDNSSRRLRWTGMTAGIGLLVIAVSCLGIAAALGPAVLTINAATAPPVDPNAVAGTANRLAHLTLAIGTLIGRSLYPVWAIFVGLGAVARPPIHTDLQPTVAPPLT